MKVLFAIVAFSALTAHAQIAIYKHKLTGTITGNGAVQRFTTLGYTVLDLATADCVQILYTAPLQTCRVEKWDRYSADYIETAPGKQSYVLIKQRAELDESGKEVIASTVYQGQCSLTDIGAQAKYSIPSNMSVSGHSSFFRSSKPCLEQTKGSLALDMKRTKAANTFRDNLAQVTARLVQELEGNGYRALD